MTWQFLITLQLFPAAAQVLVLRQMARRGNPQGAAALNAGIFVIMYLCALPFLPLLGVPVFQQILPFWPLLTVSAFCFALTNVFIYKALEHLDASIMSILGTLGTVFTLILAWIFLHEQFGPRQWVGAVILMSTIWFALWLTHQEKKHHPVKQAKPFLGVFYTILVSLLTSVALVCEKYLLGHMTSATYMTFGWGLQLFMAIALAVLFDRAGIKRLWRAPGKGTYRLGLTAGVLRGAAGVLFVLSQVWSNNLPVVVVISNFKIILIALFGALVLNEQRFMVRKMLAASVAVAALAVIFWP